MRIESIKLSPKRGGNGYVSSYSISIAGKEAESCQLINKRIFKIIDEEKQEITIRAKHYTLSTEVIQNVCQMKRVANQENQNITKKYCKNPSIISMAEAFDLWCAQHKGEAVNNAEISLEKYLTSLSIETIVDLTLLMYLGRDFDVNMHLNPGEERFLEFYDRYNYLVLGQEKNKLIEIMMEKEPLPKYLEYGVRILNADKDTSIDELPPLDWSEFRSNKDDSFFSIE